MTSTTKEYAFLKITTKGYVYFRMPSGKLIPLKAKQGTPEFDRAYEACVAQREAVPTPEARVSDGKDSVAAAIAIYLASPGFLGNRESTKKRIRRHCEQLRGELGDCRLADLDTDAIDIYSERIEVRQGASVADRHVHVISSIWKNVKKWEQFGIKKMPNPTVEARQAYEVQQEHRPWPVEVQEQFMAAAPEHLQLAKLLLHFSVQRGGDCCKMLWTDFDGQGIYVRPEKTHGERDAQPTYHLCPDPLIEALEAAPRVAETILVNAYGQRYANVSVLSKAMRRYLIKVGAARKGERTFVMHGLRKTGATDAAEAGVEGKALQGLGGWKTIQMAEHYTKTARAKIANKKAIDLWNAELMAQAERKAHEREIEERRAQIHRVV
jgi:integrase